MISPNYSESRAGIQVVPDEQRLHVFAARGTGRFKFRNQSTRGFSLLIKRNELPIKVEKVA